MSYRELLADPRWQKKRLEILQLKGFKCEECLDETSTLHVHHRYYVSRRLPWLYPDFCYQVLCRRCHDSIRISAEADREEGSTSFEAWETGLDHFGDRIYEMAFNELIDADYRAAHGLPPFSE